MKFQAFSSRSVRVRLREVPNIWYFAKPVAEERWCAYEPNCPYGSSEDYPSYCNIKRPEVFVLTPGLDANPSQGYPDLKFVRTQLYTWLERGNVRVKRLAQRGARTRTARSKTIQT